MGRQIIQENLSAVRELKDVPLWPSRHSENRLSFGAEVERLLLLFGEPKQNPGLIYQANRRRPCGFELGFTNHPIRLVKGLRQVGAKDLETANAYLEKVFLALWNRRFLHPPQLAGDAHRALQPGTNLGSVLSIRESRTVSADYTVRWDGVIYRVKREQIGGGMRGARVQLERRLDGSRWMHWRNQILALEACETRPEVMVERRLKTRATPERSAEEKARAQQRLLDARRQWRESYNQLRNRPIWQAMKDASLRAGELR